MSKHSESEASSVPKAAKQDAQAQGRDGSWAQACVWNERMLAALDNGVKGGKWFSLIDKVHQPVTLQAAWRKVAANAGAAGVDRQSVEPFAARAEQYLGELGAALKAGKYQPMAVLRVEIPKRRKRTGAGHTLADHKRWPNAYFAELGLFTMTEAHALASQSR